MAQYFQVLSQSDKPSAEELRQYYPNIVENQAATVQYVISQTDQAFPGQQILVSSDQVMLVDGQPQQIIVDQSQVQFTNQQYVVQDASIEFQETPVPHQIFYVDETTNMERIDAVEEEASIQEQPVQQQLLQQPVVLNHQLQNSSMHSQLTNIVRTPAKLVVSGQQPNQLHTQNPTITTIPHRQIQIPQIRQPQTIVQNRSLTPQQKLLQQARAASTGPRQPMPLNVKTPQMRFNQPHPDLSKCKPATTEKKLPPRVLNQVKSPKQNENDDQKKKASRNNARPRGPRGGQFNSLLQPNSSVPRPLNRASMPHQGLLQRPRQPPPQPQHQPASIQQQQQVIHNPSYIIQPPQNQQASLASFEPSSQIKQIIDSTPTTDEFSDSIRMLVQLSNGEQRLITFTLPKEQCTIQEILEQIGLPIQHDTIIKCQETHGRGINYFVEVQFAKNPPTMQEEQANKDKMVESEEVVPKQSHQPPVLMDEAVPKPPSPELPKEQPKTVPGKLAVCINCGYLSEHFNRCLRCKRALPGDVKSVDVCDQPTAKKPDILKYPSGKDKKALTIKTTNGTTNNTTKLTTPTANHVRKRVSKPKVVDQDPIILTLSSDEEEDPKLTSSALKTLESQIAASETKKEPSFNEIESSETANKAVKDDKMPQLTTSIYCRTVRIGSYKFIPTDNNILVSTKEVVIKVPLPDDPNDVKVLRIPKSKLVKVLANFQKVLPVIFYYVNPSMAAEIRTLLTMEEGTDYYFDPLSKEEHYRRITILPDCLGEEAKLLFKKIYGNPHCILAELNSKEANSILLKTCPKEVSKTLGSMAGSLLNMSEIKQLIIYPPGKGGLPINTEDYLCLAQDQFLNDVIIDFYLKYLVLQFPQEKQDKIHIFSTFFYKRLTTKPLKVSRRLHPSEVDSNLTPAEKRHARVKKWTKNLNIFEKDFVVVPINESAHWFLAIICFPALDGCYTMDEKPINLSPLKKRAKKGLTIGNVTITRFKEEKDEAMVCEEGSDKDEAEGDDSELESEEEAEEPKVSAPTVIPPIKQPCILIFDSLAGASRSRVVATLRDYLSCEYKIKMQSEKVFNKDNMKCACPKVPQQTNFTDCGLYLLQYVESFFENPIRSYQLPIHELKTWFAEITVTKKREDIANIIKELMIKYNKDPEMLPELLLPTYNGRLVSDEDDDMDEDVAGEESSPSDQSGILPSKDSETGEAADDAESDESIVKPSQSSVELNQNFREQIVTTVKPDTSEIRKPSNRETLSYLKAKRIIRHKNSDGPDVKKVRPTDDI